MKTLLSLKSWPILMLSLGLLSTAALADPRSNRDHDDNDRDRGYSNRGNSNQQFDNRDFVEIPNIRDFYFYQCHVVVSGVLRRTGG